MPGLAKMQGGDDPRSAFLATQGSGKDCYDGGRPILRALAFELRAGKGSTRDDKKLAGTRAILARSAW